jgi:hypothetical protein
MVVHCQRLTLYRTQIEICEPEKQIKRGLEVKTKQCKHNSKHVLIISEVHCQRLTLCRTLIDDCEKCPRSAYIASEPTRFNNKNISLLTLRFKYFHVKKVY